MAGSENGDGGHAPLGSQDLHVHTTMSDGDLTVEAVVEVALRRGIAVGVADHVSGRNVDLFVADRERLDRYLGVLDGASVFRSGELCWCDRFSTSLPEEVIERFDYLIGSNHGFALPDGTFASPWWQELPPAWAPWPHLVMDAMVANLCAMVAAMPIAVAAHPTLLPPALFALEADVHAWWTEEREDRFIEAAVRSGVALEISNRYRLPHDRFLRKARQAGARFALGSDGHHASQVARLDWAVAAALRAGIADDQLFTARRRDRPR
jgi:histidinol phosphatase-like PHP family hydrolase